MDRQCEAAETKSKRAEVLKDQLVDLFCAGRSFVFHSATCGGLYYDRQTDRHTGRKGFCFVGAIWFSRPSVIVPFVIVSLKILF